MSTGNNINPGVVPWLNPDQFKKVYEYLFSNDILKKRWAIDEISVWETKCHPSLPSAIEATFLLTSAVVQDILWSHDASLIQHTDLQAIYGSAITRFVSLTVDTNRDKDYPNYYSSAQVAKSIGIPAFIIDIRNEWCHSSRPSLSVLRLAAESALKFLKQSYWDKEAFRIKSYVKHAPNKIELFSLFKDFIKFFEDVHKGAKVKLQKSDNGSIEVNREYVRIMKNLEKYLKKDVRFFVKILVSNGIFIPSDKDLKYMISEEEFQTFNIDLDINDAGNEDEKMDTDDFAKALDFEKENFPELPEYHEVLWEPVIKLLNKYDAVPLFMEDLLISQGNRTIAGQKLLISWILKILRIHNPEYPIRSRRLKKIFRNKGIVPNWNSMLHSAVINPCKYLMIALPLILNNANLKEYEKYRIVGMISIKLGFTPKINQEKGYHKIFHTAEDLKNAMELQRNVGKEKSPDSTWLPYPDKCHKLWPIGHIINPVKDEDGEPKEKFESILKSVSMFENDFNERVLPSNKNEDEDYDDDDQTSKRRPDLGKILDAIKEKDTVILRSSE